MIKLLTIQTAALAAGFVIDFFVGDPHALPHPVVGIGKLISFFDRFLRRCDKRDIFRGALTAVAVVLISTVIPAAVLYGAWRLHPAVYFAIDSIMCWQLLAARCRCLGSAQATATPLHRERRQAHRSDSRAKACLM